MCQSFNKVFLIIVNTIFFLVGAACLAVGIWVVVSKDSLFSTIDLLTRDVKNWDQAAYDNYKNSTSLLMIGAYILIALGGFTFIVGACGCIGGCKDSKCLLYLYSFLVLLIVAAEITAGVLVIVYKNEVENQLRQRFTNLDENVFIPLTLSIGANSTGVNAQITILLGYAHVAWGCCGVNSSDDITKSTTQWYKSERKYDPGTGVKMDINHPITCCPMKDTKNELLAKSDWSNYKNYLKDPLCPFSSVGAIKRGCYDEAMKFIEKMSLPLIIVGIGVGILELSCIIAACCLIRQISRSAEYKS